MSHRFLYTNLIGESTGIASTSAAAGLVGGAVPRLANGPGAVVFSGAYTGDGPEIYTIEIDAEGDVGTATFKWRKSSTTAGTWEASGITVALAATALEAGVSVRFEDGSSSPAFRMGDRWQATATRFRSPRRVYDLDPATKWRTASPPADPEFVSFDLGGAQEVKAAVLHGHNITPGATVKVQGGPDPQDYSLDVPSTTGNYVSVAHHSSLDLTAACTFEAVIKLNSVDATIATKRDANVFAPYIFVVDGAGAVGFQYYNGSAWINRAGNASAVPTGSFVRIGCTVSADRSSIKFYVNGAPAGTAAGSGTGVTGTTKPLLIGANWSKVGMDGLLQSIHIYSRELSAAEMLAHESGVFTDESGLVLHHKIDEGTGTALADSSANTNTGTIIGAITWTTDVYSPLSETLTWRADTMHRYLTSSTKTYRYWRVLIEGDAANPDGHIEIAEIFLGDYFEPAFDYEFGNVLGEQAFEEARESESKAEKTILLNRGRTATLPYSHVSAAQKAAFLAMFRAVKDVASERSKSFFAHLDVNDGASMIFASLIGAFAPREEAPDDFAFDIELRERIS